MNALKLFTVVVLAFTLAACGSDTSGVASASVYECDGFADLFGDGRGADLTHLVYVFPDGSVMATCEVEGGYDMASSFRLYRPTDPGSKGGACAATFDLDATSNGGYWEFVTNADHTASKVIYIDSGSPYDKKVFALHCTDY